MSRLPRLSLSPVRLGRRVVRLKRYIVNRRGDGVHPPYAFYLITKVIRNQHPYYCFEDLARQSSSSPKCLNRRECEFVFRLVLQEQCRSACLLALEDSPTSKYLEATKQLDVLYTSWPNLSEPAPDILIVESTRDATVEDLATLAMRMQAQHERSFILISQRGSMAKRQARSLVSQVSPRTVIDLLDLLLLVQDNRLTYGRHKAFL